MIFFLILDIAFSTLGQEKTIFPKLIISINQIQSQVEYGFYD